MPITFTRAPLVPRGGAPTSTEMAALSTAANDRIMSGVADWAWRIAYYLINLWRQPRNPDASGLQWGPQLEYFDIYGAINPDWTSTLWPAAPAGDPEGANLACTGMALVHGNPSVVNEPDRFAGLPLNPSLTSSSPDVSFWELGKLQRGGYDRNTGARGWPAGDAAQSWMRIVSHHWSPHGKSYGGYLPTPEKITVNGSTECGDTAENGAGAVNWQFKFTATSAGVTVPAHHGTLDNTGPTPVIRYGGSCPCGTLNHAVGHVRGIIKAGRSIYVYTSASTTACEQLHVDVLDRDDWIEGPYTGYGELMHTDGEHLNRVINAFASTFRGSAYQRSNDTYKIQRIAFPAEEVLTAQYYLAPAKGVEDQQTGTINVDYPTAIWGYTSETYSIPSDGVSGKFTSTGQTTHACSTGFVIAGVFAKAQKLQNTISVQVLDGSTLLTTIALTPDANGDASKAVWFRAPTCNAALEFKISGTPTFSQPTGYIQAEAAELEERKPDYWDLAMLCRLGAAGNGYQVDGRGIDTDTSRDIGLSYLTRGCIIGSVPNYTDAVNDNAVYDAARNMTNQCLRIINRRQFHAYEVDAQGRSVLYLKRYAYGLSNQRVDLLDGIAPPVDEVASTLLQEGEIYVVESATGTGSVTYDGATYTNGQLLVANTETEYTKTGDAMVFVYEGIKPTALKKGWTNEWCSFVELKRYKNSETSIFKPAAYTDHFSLADRCLFYLGGDVPSMLPRFFNYNYGTNVDGVTGDISYNNPRTSSQMYAPEAPPGYRYLEGINNNSQYHYIDRFRKSCRVYEPPVKLYSCTVHDRANHIVKLVFDGRFHTHEDAPSTWSMTPPTWNPGDPKPQAVLDLEAEINGSNGYRSVDNGLRAYAVHIANPHWEIPIATEGDNGQQASFGDTPHGAGYPAIFLVSLLSKPYEDGNAKVNPHDTRMTVDELQKLELYQRAGCEGWMDEAVTLDTVCANNPWPLTGEGTIYDFTWESLNYQAHGGRGIGLMSDLVRTDKPEGFGPFPNTRLYIETFNKLAANLNLLTKARLPVTAELQYSYDEYTGTAPQSFPNGYADNLVGPDPGTFFQTFGWTAGAGSPRFDVSAVYSGSLLSREQIVTHRVVVDPAWSNCIPSHLLAHLNERYGGFIAHKRVTEDTEQRQSTTDPLLGEDCAGSTTTWGDGNGTYYYWDIIAAPPEVTCEAVPLLSQLRASKPGPSDYRVSTLCANDARSVITYTPIVNDAIYIEVPLEDYAP